MCDDPVLFVDGDLISRLMTCAILRECGFTVLEAHSIAEATRILDFYPQLCALVVDVELASGEGFELAERARAVDPDLPVIYLTGADLQRCASDGVDGSRFARRPIDHNHLVRLLDATAPVVPARLH